MNRNLTATALALLLAGCGTPSSQQGAQDLDFPGGQLTGISAHELQSTPPWEPDGQKEPPVTLSKAVQLAHAALDQEYPGYSWKLQRVELRQIEGRWLYQTNFADEQNSRNIISPIILMDGTIKLPRAALSD